MGAHPAAGGAWARAQPGCLRSAGGTRAAGAAPQVSPEGRAAPPAPSSATGRHGRGGRGGWGSGAGGAGSEGAGGTGPGTARGQSPAELLPRQVPAWTPLRAAQARHRAPSRGGPGGLSGAPSPRLGLGAAAPGYRPCSRQPPRRHREGGGLCSGSLGAGASGSLGTPPPHRPRNNGELEPGHGAGLLASWRRPGSCPALSPAPFVHVLGETPPRGTPPPPLRAPPSPAGAQPGRTERPLAEADRRRGVPGSRLPG